MFRERLSYSYLHLLACPYAAFLRYEKAIRGRKTRWLALGSSVHLAIYNEHIAEEWSYPRAVDFFTTDFSREIEENEIVINYPELKKLTSEGIEMLATYHKGILDGQIQEKPLAVEKEFEIEIGGSKVYGIIDRIEFIDGYGLVVSDNKTGKNKPTDWDLKHDPQGTTYWIATKELYGEYPREYRWHSLRKGEYYSTSRTEDDIKNLGDMIQNAVTLASMGVKHRIYHTKVCEWCDYRGDICDDFSEG